MDISTFSNVYLWDTLVQYMGHGKAHLRSKKEIEKLVKEINEHNYRYHVLDAPVISDEEYDRLFRRLQELEEQYNHVLPDSPTKRVGAPPLEKFQKVRHAEPMLSLDNAFSHDEVREFDQRVKRFLKSDAGRRIYR